MFDFLNDVLAEYNGQEDIRNVPINVDALWPMIKKRCPLDEIVIEQYDAPAVSILGRVTFYESGAGKYPELGAYARIQYSSALNMRWKRFVVCKELWQCCLDRLPEERICTVDRLMQLGEWLVTDSAFKTEEYRPGSTEDQAEILALETLFPMELRRSLLDSYDKGDLTSEDLANRFEIPDEYIKPSIYHTYFSWANRARGQGLIDLS